VSGATEIREVRSRRDRRDFLRLPWIVHRGHEGWIPPLLSEDRAFFDPRRNRAHAYSDTVRFIARRDGAPVGRIMGIVNRRYNAARGERKARFACLECGDDPALVRTLLERIEDWAAGLGMSRIIGPMGFTDQDPQGFLMAGYEHRPSIGTYYNHPFLPRRVEEAGYGKEMDYAVYRIDLGIEVPEFYRNIAERAARRGVGNVMNFNRKRDLKLHIKPVLSLMNHCFTELYGYSALDEGEMAALARRFLPVLDPRFIKAVVSGGEFVGFNIAMPNLAEGFKKANGRLFPFGFIHILRAGRRTRQLDTLVGGVRSDFRGKGVDAMIGSATIAAAIRAGFSFVDSHHELEDNRLVRSEMERLGGRVYKTYRIFGKDLGREP
jgi:hypothetical protein